MRRALRIGGLGLALVALTWVAPAAHVAADGVGNGLSVAVTADGSRLVAGGDVRALYELDPETLAVKRRVHLGRRVQEMAFSKDGSTLVAAAWMGKLKTVAQSVALSLALLPLWTLVGDWIFWVNGITMTIAVALTVASGIDYIVTEVRGARAARSTRSA